MEHGPLAVAVVIATRNRAGRLAAMLASLRDQTLARERFEVVVVDDGSTDGTREVLSAEIARGDLDLRVLDGPQRGPGPARNVGWREARGRLVAFSDDDCVAGPAWLEALLEAAGPAGDRFVQGPTTPIEAEIAEQGRHTYTYDIRALAVEFPTCNMAYPRELLERLGGFDDGFTATGEDTDLAWRAIAAGAEPVFADAAAVRHAVVHMAPRDQLRRAWNWSTAMPVFARHPELRRRRLIYRFFWNWSHWYLVRLFVALLLPWGVRWWPLKVWLGHRYVEDRLRVPGEERASARTLAWNLLVDTVEVAGAARGSVPRGILVL